jgi:NADH-ubiquinone oxidoreductase chain 5
VTAGVYLLIRFYFSLSFFLSSIFFCFVSLITMFFRGFLAFFEIDIKKVVAISTLSQLGMIIFSISFGE